MIKFFIQCFFTLLITVEIYGNEESYLSNILQLTYPEMGFIKAGEGYFSPDEQSIIFQAVPEGKSHYQMFVMGLEEGIPKMVSTGEGACTCGYFHPNGNKIIFASSHESPLYLDDPSTPNGNYKWDLTPYMNIYEANPDGTSLKPLTFGSGYHAECAYSADGKEIVYASNDNGSMNIYVMDSNGSNVRQITNTSHCYNGGSFFSPNGDQILFRADRDKPHYLQLYVIDSDGSNERQLTFNDSVNWAPYWHPEGKYIAFTKSLNKHRSYEIFLLNVDTGDEKRITFNQSFDGLPVFNRDGSKIMWTSKRSLNGTCQLFIADFKLN